MLSIDQLLLVKIDLHINFYVFVIHSCLRNYIYVGINKQF